MMFEDFGRPLPVNHSEDMGFWNKYLPFPIDTYFPFEKRLSVAYFWTFNNVLPSYHVTWFEVTSLLNSLVYNLAPHICTPLNLISQSQETTDSVSTKNSILSFSRNGRVIIAWLPRMQVQNCTFLLFIYNFQASTLFSQHFFFTYFLGSLRTRLSLEILDK